VEKPNSIATVVFLLALLLGALAVGFWLFRSFLQPLAFAIVIGVGFYPFYLWVRRKVRGPNRSALLATVAVLLIFVLPASLIASAAGAQLIKTAQYLGDRSAQEGGAAAYLGDKQKRVMVWLGRYVDVEELRIQDALDNLPGQVSKFLLAAGTGLVGGLAGFAGNAILTFLILFFIFRDGEAATSNVAGMLPLGPNQAKRLLTASRVTAACTCRTICHSSMSRNSMPRRHCRSPLRGCLRRSSPAMHFLHSSMRSAPRHSHSRRHCASWRRRTTKSSNFSTARPRHSRTSARAFSRHACAASRATHRNH